MQMEFVNLPEMEKFKMATSKVTCLHTNIHIFDDICTSLRFVEVPGIWLLIVRCIGGV